MSYGKRLRRGRAPRRPARSPAAAKSRTVSAEQRWWSGRSKSICRCHFISRTPRMRPQGGPPTIERCPRRRAPGPSHSVEHVPPRFGSVGSSRAAWRRRSSRSSSAASTTVRRSPRSSAPRSSWLSRTAVAARADRVRWLPRARRGRAGARSGPADRRDAVRSDQPDGRARCSAGVPSPIAPAAGPRWVLALRRVRVAGHVR